MNQVGEVEIDEITFPVYYSDLGMYYYIWRNAGDDGKYPQIIEYQKELKQDDITNINLI